MSFSSDRERRLWGWTLALVLGIYATLGLGTTLAGAIPDHNLTTGAFLLSMFMVAATIIAQGLRTRPGGLEVGLLLGIAVVYYMVLLRMTLAERSHIIEYSVVAVFIYEALHERKSQGWSVPVLPLLAIGATTLIGVVDEGIQLFLPSRVFDPTDMLFNLMAAAMAVIGMMGLGGVRRWRSTQKNKPVTMTSTTSPSLTVSRAIRSILVTALSFGLIGMGLGALLGTLAPGAIRLLPIPNVDTYDPVELGLALGLFNGVTWGLVVSVIVVIVISWKEARRL